MTLKVGHVNPQGATALEAKLSGSMATGAGSGADDNNIKWV